MMKITDEMVTVQRLAEQRVEAEGGSINAVMRAGLEAVAPLIVEAAFREIQTTRAAFITVDDAPVHAAPPPGSAKTACCRRVPFELLGHRMAADPTLVTCPAAPSGGPTGGTPNLRVTE